jgi:hypothetical protein
MSDMEKAQQLAELMESRETQRRDLAHLQLKGARIVDAYRAFASKQSRWSVDPSSPDRVFLSRPEPNERDLPQYLLSQADLAQHVREIAAAEQALTQTTAKLTTLGITGLA